MDRDSFVMHRNFLEGIPENEQFKWFKIICVFAFDGIEPQFNNWLEEKVWIHIKSRIVADREAYEIKKEKNRAKVNKWRKEHGFATDAENDVTVTEVTDGYNGLQVVTLDTPGISVSDSEFKSVSVSDYDSESVFKSVSDSRKVDKMSTGPQKKTFEKPTLEEIKGYVSEKGYTFSPEAFFNFYESNGWKVGKNAMKSWKSACVTWQEREPKTGTFDNTSSVDYSSPDWKQEDW